MNRPSHYNTKQREAVLNYVASRGGAHVTAAKVFEHFQNENADIGRTTVYRHLDKLTEAGRLRRFTTDGVSGACFQYVAEHEHCDAHLHLKCEGCGRLLHLECDEVNQFEHHLLSKHAFEVNTLKTVLYGRCDNCQE